MASGAKVLEMQFVEFVEMCRARRVEQTALELKRCLQRRRGLSRFRQQLIGPDGEILHPDLPAGLFFFPIFAGL